MEGRFVYFNFTLCFKIGKIEIETEFSNKLRNQLIIGNYNVRLQRQFLLFKIIHINFLRKKHKINFNLPIFSREPKTLPLTEFHYSFRKSDIKVKLRFMAYLTSKTKSATSNLIQVYF